jgi:hypothetical protein
MSKRYSKKAPKASELTNFYEQTENDIEYINPNPWALQHPFRAILVGCTGSGKTNVALNILKTCACFTKFWLIAKCPDESLYELLKKKLENVCAMDGSDALVVGHKLSHIPKLETLNKEDQNIILIDDMITECPKNLREYVGDLYIRSRKFNCSVMFLSQTYFDIPKNIRTQTKYYVFKRLQSKRDKNMVAKDCGLPDDELLEISNKAEAHDFRTFLLIDNENKDEYMRQRIGFRPAVEYIHEHNIELK